MTRIRLAEWPVPHPPNWELCNRLGAAELGVPLRDDDDLVLLYPEGTEPETRATWVETMRKQGYEVVDG